MSVTRHEIVPHCRIEPHGDTNRLIVDCGFQVYRFCFDDLPELREYIRNAVTHAPYMPLWAATPALDYATQWLGQYEDVQLCDTPPDRDPDAWSGGQGVRLDAGGRAYEQSSFDAQIRVTWGGVACAVLLILSAGVSLAAVGEVYVWCIRWLGR